MGRDIRSALEFEWEEDHLNMLPFLFVRAFDDGDAERSAALRTWTNAMVPLVQGEEMDKGAGWDEVRLQLGYAWTRSDPLSIYALYGVTLASMAMASAAQEHGGPQELEACLEIFTRSVERLVGETAVRGNADDIAFMRDEAKLPKPPSLTTGFRALKALLVRRLTTGSLDDRAGAALALMFTGPPAKRVQIEDAIRRLACHAKDPRRQDLVFALGQCGASTDEFLSDDDERVRFVASLFSKSRRARHEVLTAIKDDRDVWRAGKPRIGPRCQYCLVLDALNVQHRHSQVVGAFESLVATEPQFCDRCQSALYRAHKRGCEFTQKQAMRFIARTLDPHHQGLGLEAGATSVFYANYLEVDDWGRRAH